VRPRAHSLNYDLWQGGNALRKLLIAGAALAAFVPGGTAAASDPIITPAPLSQEGACAGGTLPDRSDATPQ
jgi:hypothetical protein